MPNTLLEYLEDHPESAQLLEEVRRRIENLGSVTEEISRSQVSFRAKRTFAWAWAPGQYLEHGAPLVLTVALPFRDPSSRWKEVVEPSPGRFTHHLELRYPGDIDEDVCRALRVALLATEESNFI